jgi:AcrR family transcriptional regulator
MENRIAMPKLKPDTQRARRERILEAAEICFARHGFHRCTMQDICREAGISPGALYVYFSSKEDLIAGIAERDRSEFAAHFGELSRAPDFLSALSKLGDHYFVEQPVRRQRMCVEIGVESTRNEAVGEIFRSVDTFVQDSFASLFRRLADEGRINPQFDAATMARVMVVIGDGMFWRRAVDPAFDATKVMPAVLTLVEHMLSSGAAAPAAASTTAVTPDTAEVD